MDNDDEVDEADDFIPNLHRRIIHPRINYHLNATVFRQSFRVDMEVIVELEALIGMYLIDTNLNNALTPRQQILTALHFLGNGSQYHVNGYMHGISKATVFRCIHRICRLITFHVMPIYVRWPTSSHLIQQQFFNIAGFPHVKGIIDGTLVRIDAPQIDEPVYVGRDSTHSINVVIVSGPQNQIFFASAKSPGSFHDSRALRVSNLWDRWEIEGWRPDRDVQSIILGDSAYPLTSWLIPPTVRAVNANNRLLVGGVQLYQTTHRKTRFIVERTIGILKEEYPCLNHFRFKTPYRIATAIYACVTLHNMQNHYRRGSYAYDAVLSRIANQRAPIDEGHGNENVEQNNPDGILRQHELLGYFARITRQH